jgi:large subunit ribosomal protein L21
MMMKLNPFAGRTVKRSWFWWGINFGIFLALAVWWWLENQPKEGGEFKLKVKPLIKPDEVPEITPPPALKPAAVKPAKPDDLKVIEGVGPKSAQALSEAGIITFAKLASMGPDEIQAVLRAAGVRVPYPETWPEQAALAADGQFAVLKELQNSLKGGRRS